MTPVGLDDDRAFWLFAAEELVDGVTLPAWVPTGPYLRALDADGGPEQREGAMRERLRFLDPGDAEALEGLDAFGGVILHALEDDEAIAGRLDAVVEDAEQRPNAECLDLAFDEAL